MKNSYEDTIREFVRSASDEDVNYINIKFRDNLQGDLADLFYFVSKTNVGDVFAAARNVHELYGYCDMLKKAVIEDLDKRDFSDRAKPKKRARR